MGLNREKQDDYELVGQVGRYGRYICDIRYITTFGHPARNSHVDFLLVPFSMFSTSYSRDQVEYQYLRLGRQTVC